MTVNALANALQNFGRGRAANVGCDERVFELVQDPGVDFLAPTDGVLELLHQPRARFLDAGFEAFEEAGRARRRWRFRGRIAEQGLDHEAPKLQFSSANATALAIDYRVFFDQKDENSIECTLRQPELDAAVAVDLLAEAAVDA